MKLENQAKLNGHFVLKDESVVVLYGNTNK